MTRKKPDGGGEVADDKKWMRFEMRFYDRKEREDLEAEAALQHEDLKTYLIKAAVARMKADKKKRGEP